MELRAVVCVPEVDEAGSKVAKEKMAVVTYEGAGSLNDVGLFEVA